MTEEQKVQFGWLIDRVDNLKAAAEVPLPPKMHLVHVNAVLPELSAAFKKLFIEITGENPWE